jgi:hypothetical protein
LDVRSSNPIKPHRAELWQQMQTEALAVTCQRLWLDLGGVMLKPTIDVRSERNRLRERVSALV